MIFKRAVAKLRAQDWTAIFIEFAIVVSGVFLGTWVANWNQERLSKERTRHLLVQLTPEIDRIVDFSDNARAYYATTRRFAGVAFKGWDRDPGVSDQQFVIAAYQASQIHGMNNSPNWTLIFGGDEYRNIDDMSIRQPLGRLMTFNVDNLNSQSVATPYRADVRKVIPDDIQQQIRAACGDRLLGSNGDLGLPPTCDISLDPGPAARTASILRAHPELLGELRGHLGLLAGFLNTLVQYEFLAKRLQQRLGALKS